jgi:predicted ArsR family transcriptional regulator
VDDLTEAKGRLLQRLKRLEPATAQELAGGLGITDVAARQHLQVLEGHGLVEQEPRVTGERGRPAKLWRLTTLGRGAFPDRHGELTVSLLSTLRSELGEEAVERLIGARAREQTREYQSLIQLGRRSLRSKLETLARQRSAEGYMAEIVDEGRGSYLLIEHHCPICVAARACTGLCAAELEVFRNVLGPDVRVERTAHLLAGDVRCVYRVHAGV